LSRTIVVGNGPNLNLQGVREPEIYGRETLADIEAMLQSRARERGAELAFFQTNHEGELIDRLQRESQSAAGIVLNPGAFTHYSYALYDCLKALTVPVIEVHLSNLFRRPEGFRRSSVTAPAARGVISGLGPRGYLFALEYLLDLDQ
jgi:3-dehydroquinate dehydratase-2